MEAHTQGLSGVRDRDMARTWLGWVDAAGKPRLPLHPAEPLHHCNAVAAAAVHSTACHAPPLLIARPLVPLMLCRTRRC